VSSLYLFSGQNSFALFEEVRRWTDHFITKYGSENFLKLEAADLTLGKLLDEVAVAPFIAEKRLVVVAGVPKLSKSDLQMLAGQIHLNVLLLFVVELSTDRRRKPPAILKDLAGVAEHRMFPLLTHAQLQGWLQEQLKELGASMTQEAERLLLEIIGEDQAMLLQELRKLSIYASGSEIAPQHVLALVVSMGEGDDWHFMDLLGEGRVEEALTFAHQLLKRGVTSAELWNRLLWRVSQLVLVSGAVAEGVTQPNAIAAAVGMNPYVARSLLASARRLKPDALASIVDRVVEMDVSLKTGAFKSTVEAPEEMNAIVDRCILAFREG